MLSSFRVYLNNDVNAVDGNFCTILHSAAGQRNPAAVRALLSRGAKVDAQCNTLSTPLHMATLVNDLETVNVLTAEGKANVNIRDQLGATPLYTAARFGFVGIVRALLGKGANPDIRNISGETALHIAALGGHFDVVKILLLEGRASINIRTIYGETSLDKAEMNRSLKDLEQFLKDNGAEKGVFTEPPFLLDYDLQPRFEPTLDQTKNSVQMRP